jgi:hypothetical protein
MSDPSLHHPAPRLGDYPGSATRAVLMQFGSVAAATQLHQNRGAVEAVNKFENLVILEWHSITEPRAVDAADNAAKLVG